MSALRLFAYQDQQVRTVTVDGEPRFVLTDVCSILGLTNPSMVAGRVDPDALSTAEVIDSMGRVQPARTVDETGLYEVIFMSRKDEARTFKRWVTTEVLPTIRRTGSYSVAPVLPQSYTEALRELLANVEAKEQAEARAKELEVPAQAWDVMVSANGDYAVDEAAKILSRDPAIEIGRNRLFTFMQELGWIYRQGARRNWHAYQSQVDNGRIKLRMTAAFLNAKTGEMENPAPTIRITAKGLEALRAKLVPTRELVDA